MSESNGCQKEPVKAPKQYNKNMDDEDETFRHKEEREEKEVEQDQPKALEDLAVDAAKDGRFGEGMQQWTVEHRVFAYDSFVKNKESVTAAQREFRRHFNLIGNEPIPARNTILRWVRALRTRGTLMNIRPSGATRTARTPENVEIVRQALLRSPNRSTRKHAAELGLSNRSVRRIMHLDLHFPPHKLTDVGKESGDQLPRTPPGTRL